MHIAGMFTGLLLRTHRGKFHDFFWRFLVFIDWLMRCSLPAIDEVMPLHMPRRRRLRRPYQLASIGFKAFSGVI
jgi:hypothetical protein